MTGNNNAITPDMVSYITTANFSENFEVYESNPLYSLSPLYINTLLDIRDLKADDRRLLLGIRNYIFQKKGWRIPEESAKTNIFDVSEWLANQTFAQFRKLYEDCSFSIEKPDNDLKGKEGNYVAWVSKSDKKINAEAVTPSKTCLNIGINKWALNFHKETRYQIENIGLRDTNAGVCMCITFKIDSNYKGESFIISDGDDSDPNNCRGISYVHDTLRIWGALSNGNNYESIELINIDKVWWTVFIFWPSKKESIYGGRYYIHNNYLPEIKINGNFTASSIDFIEHVTLLGSKSLHQKGFEGSIAALDIFRKKPNIKLPSHLINLIINEQMMSINK